MSKKQILIADTFISNKIYFVRGQKVMLDYDLAELYDVETKRLKEAVRRNFSRFPEDFMFVLTKNEFDSLRTQFASSKSGYWQLLFFPAYCFCRKIGMTIVNFI
jgi:hypothetical protein